MALCLIQLQGEEVDHPFDINYGLLKCGLKYVDPSSDSFKVGLLLNGCM